MALNERQQRFVEEYLVDLNATQAAIRAGYSPRTANEQGARLLAHVSIQEAVQAAKEKRSQRVEITQDRVLLEYARLAFFDPRKLFDDNGKPMDITALDDDTAAALVGLDVVEEYQGAGESREFVGYTKKYKLANKLGALDSLGKHLGMFDGHGGQEPKDTNIINALRSVSGEDIDLDAIQEIQPTPKSGDNVVE